MGEAGDLQDLLGAAGVVARPSRVVPLAGGDIADVRRVELENGETVVVKLGRVGSNGGVASDLETLAREESSGLGAIAATRTLPTPAVLGVATLGDRSALVLEDLGAPGSAGDADWVEFGRRLADLHAGEVVAFGFDHSNHLGRTPQDNRPVEPDDWAIFLRDRRLLPMREALERLGRADATDLADLDRLADRLEDLLPRGDPARPPPRRPLVGQRPSDRGPGNRGARSGGLPGRSALRTRDDASLRGFPPGMRGGVPGPAGRASRRRGPRVGGAPGRARTTPSPSQPLAALRGRLRGGVPAIARRAQPFRAAKSPMNDARVPHPAAGKAL